MKKQLKSLLLVAIFACTTLPAWSQASTQGKEFWVSSTIICSPDKDASKRKPTPYIAVSAEKACTVHITGGVGNAINITQQVAAGSWSEFGNGTANQTNPNAGPVKVPMDASKWYPTTMTDADKVCNLAGQKNMYGLHITATENISVYVILSTLNSMDASNILPLTALGSEYYTQDYWPIVKSDWNNTVTMTTILATEDGTKVNITPNGNTYDGHQSGQLYTVELVKGQTYYLMSQADKQLTGTHIQAKDGKKIAIFNGVPLTNLPTDIAARDGLFEQSMPIEYWGTQFIVTRSLEKNGNLIGITATNKGTEIIIDGYPQATINEGETFYMMLQSSNDPNGNKPGTSPIDLVVTADVAYIETSCPCAVYNYDTGNSYKGKNGDEIKNSQGDPSSVWVSPIQQKISNITFGTCYTSKTEDHFLNVVTETSNCTNTKLSALSYNSILQQIIEIDQSSLLVWQTVPGNPTYSYARAQIGNSSKTYNVFRLENTKGVIATIYGNGNDESYAYSAGSAAVEQGVNVNGETFTNGYRSDKKYCFGDEITFDANVGTDQISRVDWNFGDGTTEYYGPSTTSHSYTSPGWYDVTAALYGHQVCTTESEQYLGSVSFSFRIVRPDTVFGDIVPVCIPLEDYKADPARWDDSIAHPHIKEVQEHCYDTVVLNYVIYNRETEENREPRIGKDSVQGYNGKTYYASQDVVDTVLNAAECNHYIRYYVKVITCLDITVNNSPAGQYACPGDNFTVTYTKTKGDIEGMSILKIPGYADQEIDIPNRNVTDASLTIPVESITKPGIYKAQLLIKDENCGDTKSFDIDFKIFYPEDIFAYKFNNVLAVYKKGYGGNTSYEFVAYQWYRNGELIPGATESIYHTDAPFNEGDTYYVELTDQNGMKLPSCSQRIETVPDYNPQPNAMPAQKQLINNRIYILREGRTYDTYGQRVK